MLLVLPLLLTTPGAEAFTIGSPVSDGCHEAMAAETLRALRADGLVEPAIKLTASDALWVDDLPFTLPHDLHDAAAAALLAGARDPDLLGAAPSDVATLAQVHGDPAHQYAHCLRSSGDDDPGGDEAGLAGCRAALVEEVAEVFAELDDAGIADASHRTDASIWLSIAGTRDVSVPAAYWKLGRAMHTLQDAYAHTLRNDALAVTSVLNFVDFAEEDIEPGRDGAAHLPTMDACNSAGLPSQRAAAAEAASEAFARAVLNPARTIAERQLDVAAVLDESLRFEPGCTAENGWCEAPELAYEPAGCDTAGGGVGLGALVVGLAACLRRTRTASGFAGLLFVSLLSEPARAESGPSAVPVATAVSAFGLEGRVGGSLDHLAAAFSLGVRWRPSNRLVLGIDAELNPWMSAVTGEVVPGSTNVMGVVTREYPMRGERVRLSWSVRGGVSRLNMSVYGAQEGSIGPAFGVAVLGLAIDMGRGVTLVVEPDDVEVPIPHLTGVPLFWVQYRITVGVRWGAAVRD